MSNEKMDYQILQAEDTGTLALEVAEAITQGFVPIGSLVINDSGFYQPIIRRHTSNDNIRRLYSDLQTAINDVTQRSKIFDAQFTNRPQPEIGQIKIFYEDLKRAITWMEETQWNLIKSNNKGWPYDRDTKN